MPTDAERRAAQIVVKRFLVTDADGKRHPVRVLCSRKAAALIPPVVIHEAPRRTGEEEAMIEMTPQANGAPCDTREQQAGARTAAYLLGEHDALNDCSRREILPSGLVGYRGAYEQGYDDERERENR